MLNRDGGNFSLEEGNFTDNITELGLGISTETTDYTYSSHATLLSAINYSVSRTSNLESYVGGVFLGSIEQTGESTTFTILCQAKSPETNRPPAPIVENGMLQCALGTETVDRGNNQGIFIGKNWNLANISANYASAGEYTQALDSAERITDDLIQAKTLEVIATELVAAGKSKQALTIIEKIQAIALNLTDAGEYTQALRVTRHITDDSIKSKTIHAIAPYLTTATEYEQGIQVAKTLTDYEPKAKALDAIVRRLVATGNDERAVQIAQTIQSYYGGKDQAMATIERYKN
ncbi:type IV pilin-like G/H family protein [Coleofasciculus sp. E2-BRE-01]|uniref:type IV pilin-like G/H family protein n=1 Tax=Coleofasciculus sp. E2-BRE-01 TaxID=3069524 RepID=UPI00330395B0